MSFFVRMFWCVLTSLACALFFSSCSDSDHDQESTDETVARTIIVYMVAENSLNNYLPADVYEIIKGANKLSDNDCVVLYVDDVKQPRIYTIDNKTTADGLNDLQTEKLYDEDLNSASPATLAEVLHYIKVNHPAQSYGIVFWSHASGWQTLDMNTSAVNSRDHNDDLNAPGLRFSFGLDNGNNNNKNTVQDHAKQEMAIDDLAKVVEVFGKVDFILFDCCFMQTVEVAYQLRNATRYIIASPAEIPNQGAPYDQILPLLANRIDYRAIVDAYYGKYCNSNYGSVLSLVDTEGMPALATATANIYAKYKNTLEDLDLSQVNNYFNYDKCRNRKYIYPDFYDMNSVMYVWLTDDDYTEWKKAFDKVVVYSRTTDFFFTAFPGNNKSIDVSTAGCISMFFPFQKYRGDFFTDSYFRLDWPRTLGIYK